jgi:hypothetical protein
MKVDIARTRKTNPRRETKRPVYNQAVPIAKGKKTL